MGEDRDGRAGREQGIVRIRTLAIAFYVLQSTVRTGDSVAATWLLVLLLVAVQAAVVLLLRRRRVRLAGWAGMAGDAAVVGGALANNLGDPADPIFLVVVLLCLEASLRWGQGGGLVAGVGGGLAAAAWSVAVVGGGPTVAEYATMRFGVLALLGGVLGGLVERLYSERTALADMAYTDALTGLANRPALRLAIDRALRDDDGVAERVVDLLEAVEVEEQQRHAVGDALLGAVGDRLRARVRSDDVVARYGGDEFVIVLAHGGDVRAPDVARRLAAAFDDPFVVDHQRLEVGVSTGVVVAGGRDSADSLLVRADAAMYENKRRRAA